MHALKVIGKIGYALFLFFAFAGASSVLLGFIAVVIASSSVGQVATPIDTANVFETMPLLRAAAFSLSSLSAVAAAVAAYYTFKSDRRSWSLGWKEDRWFVKLLFGLGLGAAIISLGFLVIMLLGGVRIATVSPVTPELLNSLAINLLMFVAVGIGEEVLARGYFYGLVKKYSGIAGAVIISSLIFALMHSFNAAVFSSIFPMLNLTLAGVLLALVREVSGGLWMPIGVHITWNFFQGNIFGMAVSGTETESFMSLEIMNAFVAGGAFGLEGSFVCTVILLFSCAVLIRMLTRRTPAWPGSGSPSERLF